MVAAPVTVSMWWFYLVNIFQAIHGELLFFKVALSHKNEVKKRNSRIVSTCRLGRIIDDFFVLGADIKKVMRRNDRVGGELLRREYHQDYEMQVTLKNMEVTMLEI